MTLIHSDHTKAVFFEIVHRVCKTFGVKVEDALIRKSKHIEIRLARTAIVTELHELGWGYSEIGRWMRRDHSVIHNWINGKAGTHVK